MTTGDKERADRQTIEAAAQNPRVIGEGAMESAALDRIFSEFDTGAVQQTALRRQLAGLAARWGLTGGDTGEESAQEKIPDDRRREAASRLAQWLERLFTGAAEEPTRGAGNSDVGKEDEGAGNRRRWIEKMTGPRRNPDIGSKAAERRGETEEVPIDVPGEEGETPEPDPAEERLWELWRELFSHTEPEVEPE